MSDYWTLEFYNTIWATKFVVVWHSQVFSFQENFDTVEMWPHKIENEVCCWNKTNNMSRIESTPFVHVQFWLAQHSDIMIAIQWEGTHIHYGSIDWDFLYHSFVSDFLKYELMIRLAWPSAIKYLKVSVSVYKISKFLKEAWKYVKYFIVQFYVSPAFLK